MPRRSSKDTEGVGAHSHRSPSGFPGAAAQVVAAHVLLAELVCQVLLRPQEVGVLFGYCCPLGSG